MATLFNKKTFTYFNGAVKHKNSKAWFEKNQELYQENVHKPMEAMVAKLAEEFGKDLPKIDILPRKISRPIKRNQDPESGLLRSNSFISLAEKTTSMFESNPGIYFSVGLEPYGNILGIGLYQVSSRQMSLLRNGVTSDYSAFHKIITSKKLKSRLGGLSGETYKRFPKGYSEEQEGAEYLWHKQFFLSRELTQAQIFSQNFESEILKDIEVAIPFLQWTRKTVGTYKKSIR